MTEQLTSSGYSAFTSRDGLVFALFWSASCGPCLRFRRIYRAVAAGNPDTAFGEAEVETQFRLVEEMEITTIPALFVHRDGALVYRDPTPQPDSATFSAVEDAPRFRDFMYSEEKFAAFVESLR